jgi:hypothetical protein
MLARSFDRLEDLAVEAHGMTTRAERNPMQIDGGCARYIHCRLEAWRLPGSSASEVGRTANADGPQPAASSSLDLRRLLVTSGWPSALTRASGGADARALVVAHLL